MGNELAASAFQPTPPADSLALDTVHSGLHTRSVAATGQPAHFHWNRDLFVIRAVQKGSMVAQMPP